MLENLPIVLDILSSNNNYGILSEGGMIKPDLQLGEIKAVTVT
jgi:hypothetical protein